jgi:hypothetical protein
MPRKSPHRNGSGRQFFERFATEDACLAHVMETRFGLRHRCRKCGTVSSFHRLERRKAYSCARCGDHLYPCAGTIFEHSRTKLPTWFRAIYLIVASRHAISGKELQRQLGVTYKCAHRMGREIRHMLAEGKTRGF